jgi:hypothetical protein
MLKYMPLLFLIACSNNYKTEPNSHLEIKVGRVDMLFANNSLRTVATLVLWNEIDQNCSTIDVGGIPVTTCNELVEKHSRSFVLKPKQIKKIKFDGELRLRFIKTCVLPAEAGEAATCATKEY